jgi:class 3 adenylate cyclase
MDIAAAVGAERLREVMADLADRCAAVLERYGGTVDKFTGDGIMAVFGAPVALEDHAVRACLAALGIQEQTARLAAEVSDRDGVELALRIGLNSGQVIRWGSRVKVVGLHHHWRAGGHGSAHGVGRSAGWGDAQRIHRAARRERRRT